MITVIGATGNVGRPLVEALAAPGEEVTAVSRRPSDRGWPDGVRHLPADLTQLASLAPALEGAGALFVLPVGGSPRQLFDLAREVGVRRVVLLSSQGVGTRPEAPGYAPFRAFEDALRQSGLAWTILRAGGFDSNTLWWRESIRAQGTVAAPFGDVRVPTVDPADVAAVAAAALRSGRHEGHAYVLTGPAPISPRQQTQAIEDALGRPLHFQEQTPDDARARMLQFMPPAIVDATLMVLGRPSAAEVRVSPDVEQVLNRPARSFADWAQRNVDAFR